MEDPHSEKEPSLSQLFDAIGRKLDEMMQAFRYTPAGRHRPTYSLVLFDIPSCSGIPLDEQV